MKYAEWVFLAIGSMVVSEAAIGSERVEDYAAAEYVAYLGSPTRCPGAEADKTVRIGIGRFHEWKFAVDRGQEPPEKAFADAGQAYAHLYNELSCRDGLTMYRYGNLLRLNKSDESAIRIMENSLPGIRAHYPGMESTVESSLGQACASASRHDEAIAHFRRVLELDSEDPVARRNLANELSLKGDHAGARSQAEKALERPPSEHNQKVAVEILKKIED